MLMYLEEDELARVQWLSGAQIGEALDDNVRVTDDGSTIQLLGSCKVVGLGVDEVAGDQVSDGHLNSESSISRDCCTVWWVDKLA